MTKLLDAGAAPRRVLRYKVKPGWVEWVELDMAMALTVTVNGALQPKTTLPAKRVLWKLEAKEVTREGDVMLGLTVANVELLKGDHVPEPLRAQAEKEMTAARGAHGSARVSNRGIASDFGFDGIADAGDNSVLEMARVFYVTLPVEEIGKGGKWETVMRIPTMGGVMDLRSVYTVTKVDADGVRAEVASTTSAEPHQAIVVPNLPGATATLDSVSGNDKGTANVPFARLVGQTATKGTTLVALTATTPRGPLALSMTTEVEMTTRAGKAMAMVGQK